MDLKELYHPNQSMPRDPLLSYDLSSKRTQTFQKMTHLIATCATEVFRTLERHGDNTGCEYVCMCIIKQI